MSKPTHEERAREWLVWFNVQSCPMDNTHVASLAAQFAATAEAERQQIAAWLMAHEIEEETDPRNEFGGVVGKRLADKISEHDQ